MARDYEDNYKRDYSNNHNDDYSSSYRNNDYSITESDDNPNVESEYDSKPNFGSDYDESPNNRTDYDESPNFGSDFDESPNVEDESKYGDFAKYRTKEYRQKVNESEKRANNRNQTSYNVSPKDYNKAFHASDYKNKEDFIRQFMGSFPPIKGEDEAL